MATNVKRINLALQGGGAHGAFTWGVLDRLLEEDDIEIAGDFRHLGRRAERRGAEGGAGRRRARQARATIWTGCGPRSARSDDLRLAELDGGVRADAGHDVADDRSCRRPSSMADAASADASPYAYGPFYRNPLQRDRRAVPL